VPELLARFGVERCELATGFAVAAGNTRIDDTVVVKRRSGDGVAILPFSDKRPPQHLAGPCIERNECAVELADEDLPSPTATPRLSQPQQTVLMA
jgi:hypothetical protein